MKHVLRFCVLAGLMALLTPLPAFSQITVILTRHAEKAATPQDDPGLTEAGKKRAEALASMLADSGVDAIYVTQFQRTQQTAAPLAARVHVKPTIIPAADAEKLIQAIRNRKTGVVVVVGHSNSLPNIIAALGGPPVTIPETQYDNLFVLTMGPSHTSLLRLHYGSNAPVQPSGAKMMPAMSNPAPK